MRNAKCQIKGKYLIEKLDYVTYPHCTNCCTRVTSPNSSPSLVLALRLQMSFLVELHSILHLEVIVLMGHFDLDVPGFI